MHIMESVLHSVCRRVVEWRLSETMMVRTTVLSKMVK